MPRYIDLTGQRFGQLTVETISDIRLNGQACWRCVCDCGLATIVRAACLKDGTTISCGCQKGRREPKHGMWQTKEYRRWRSMKQRCQNPNAQNYPRYGGKGVTVCDRWQDFKTWFDDINDEIGPPPSDQHTIDRIDSTKGYQPGNVRWATPKQQANNRNYGEKSGR